MAVIGLVAYANYTPPIGQQFLTDCEYLLKGRLRSPSTYARVSASDLDRAPASYNEFMEIDTPEKKEWRLSIARTNPDYMKLYDAKAKSFRLGEHERAYIFIEYDADNAYGTPIRDTAECYQIVSVGKDVAVNGYLGTMLNGFGAIDWHTFRLWKTNQPGG